MKLEEDACELLLGVFSLTLGLDSTSDNGPMRAARRRGLLELGLRDRRSGWPLEMVLRANAAGWTIAELPIAYRRRAGRSKVTGTVRGTAQAIADMSAQLRGLDSDR
jgi:hypothetical protein